MSTLSDSHRLKFQERKKSFLDETILSPGAVKINVQGAFIVDQVPSNTLHQSDDGAQHDTRDIRLPNHKAVVSHVALDIGGSLAKLVYFSREPDSKEVCVFYALTIHCTKVGATSHCCRTLISHSLIP